MLIEGLVYHISLFINIFDLQFLFSVLYKSDSTRQNGTLRFFRERYGRYNVTPEKVTNSYEGCEQLLLSVGRAYIVEAALEFWGMTDINTKPSKNQPPENAQYRSMQVKKSFFDDVIGRFVDKFVMADPAQEELWQQTEALKLASQTDAINHDHWYGAPPSQTVEIAEDQGTFQPDRVNYYGHTVLELTVFLMNWIDAVREGDGERCNRMRKRLMQYFKVQSAYSKYAIEVFTNIAQTEYLLSPQLAHRITWGKFVNWQGGAGKNIEGDLVREICNRTSKNIVQGMGPNKTKEAIQRASRAKAGIHEIVTNFDGNSGIKPQSSHHTKMSSKEDELAMIQDLQKLKPFKVIPGRTHSSFSNMTLSPLTNLDMDELYCWLDKHRYQIGANLTA